MGTETRMVAPVPEKGKIQSYYSTGIEFHYVRISSRYLQYSIVSMGNTILCT